MRMIWDLPLTWVLLPLKLAIIVPLWLLHVLTQVFHKTNAKYWHQIPEYTADIIETRIASLMRNGAIFENSKYRLYCCRVPYAQRANGYNCNTDHFASRQGPFIIMETDSADEKSAEALNQCFHEGALRRGYKVNGGELDFNLYPPAGDQMIGFCMGYFRRPSALVVNMHKIARQLVDVGGLSWEGGIAPRANFRPGANWSESPVPVGAQDLTYLAGLACAMHLSDDPAFYKAFKKRLWVYGGFLTVLFPSAGLDFINRRGYNNENVSIQAAFLCREYSKTKLEKLIFSIALFNIWLMSYKWLNGFFTGLVCYWGLPWYVTKNYVKRCIHYAMDASLNNSEKIIKASTKPDEWPVDPIKQNMGEFFYDEDHVRFNIGMPAYHSVVGPGVALRLLKRHI